MYKSIIVHVFQALKKLLRYLLSLILRNSCNQMLL